MNNTPTQYVSNFPLQLSKNLRFQDSNGNIVTQLYPVGYPADSPTTGYISLIGASLSTQIDNYNQVVALLNTYNTEITTLQASVLAIQTSGATAIPQVNAGCLSSPVNQVLPINVVVANAVANICGYNNVLGTTTALSQAIAAQPTNLNSLPAFSQNSTMSGLSGWNTNPTTIAASESNQWIAYGDARAGITNALAAITPTCAQVKVAYQAVLISGPVINLYFNGYTFIPTGFGDSQNQSQIKITDASGNNYQQAFSITAASLSNTPISISTSGTTLSPTSSSYTVQVTSNVSNPTTGQSCSKVVIETLYTASSTPGGIGYDVTNYNQPVTSGTTAITAVSGLSYTPRFATIVAKDNYDATYILSKAPYFSYILGGVVINFGQAISVAGTANIDIITFR